MQGNKGVSMNDRKRKKIKDKRKRKKKKNKKEEKQEEELRDMIEFLHLTTLTNLACLHSGKVALSLIKQTKADLIRRKGHPSLSKVLLGPLNHRWSIVRYPYIARKTG